MTTPETSLTPPSEDTPSTKPGTLVPTDLVPVLQDLMTVVIQLESERKLASGDETRSIAYSIALANARRMIREWVAGPLWPIVEAEQGQPGGFGVDPGKSQGKGKAKRPYRKDEIVACVVVALVEGYRFTGDEFTILQSKVYPHTPGISRRLIEHFGVYDIIPTVANAASQHGDYVRVPAKIEYKLPGRGLARLIDRMAPELHLTIPLKGGNADTTRGKALRRLHYMVLVEVLSSRSVADLEAAAIQLEEPLDPTVRDEVAPALEPVPADTVEAPALAPAAFNVDRLVVELAEAPTKTAAAEVGHAWIREHPADKFQIEGLVGARVEEIDSTRGERSNPG